MPGKKKVRVAIIVVGNCASSLIQGVHSYRNAKPTDKVPGLMHVDLGCYHIRDIEFTAAFDVVKGKVGEDLSRATGPPRTTPSSSLTCPGWGSRCPAA